MENTSLTSSEDQGNFSNRESGGGHDVWGAETQHVRFMLSGGEYAVDISLVKEIIKPTMEPTPVPQSPPFVEGVIDLRGDIIPIIDLKKRFGIAAYC